MKSLLHRWRLDRALDDGWPLAPGTARGLERDERLRRHRDRLLALDRGLRREVRRMDGRPDARASEALRARLRGMGRPGQAPAGPARAVRPRTWAVGALALAAGLAALLFLLRPTGERAAPTRDTLTAAARLERLDRRMVALGELVPRHALDATRVDRTLQDEARRLARDARLVAHAVVDGLPRLPEPSR